MRYLCLLFLVFLASCKSLDPTHLSTVNSQLSTVNCQLSTVHSQLSTANSQLSTVHDSIVYRERIVHDTVFITKEVYRDKQLSTANSQLSTTADTIHVVEYRDRVVHHPPERYIPPFYKHCTTILFIILAAGVVWIVGKWYIKSKL